WTSWLGYTVYILVATILVFWIYRFQLSRRLALSESLRLREVSRLKNSLYTNITHEFRTPLTVILGMADSLKSTLAGKKTDSTMESLEMIQRNGNNLMRLVNEMLDLAKMESGNMDLLLIQADIVSFVKYLCESFQSIAKESQIEFTIYSEIDDLYMDFDASKLTTVISNLLSNAIKFSLPGGKIVVHINKVHDKKREFLFIRVKDEGLGISAEALPQIFNRFYQADASTSRKGEGTGIGLALTKEFIDLMGGTINVKSKEGQGSEFNLHIPITNNAPRTSDFIFPVSPELYNNSEWRKTPEDFLVGDNQLPLLLIIEDNVDVAHYLKKCLKEKYDILYAPDGIIGTKLAFDKIPDIIISDVMMPGKDGYEICSTLKSDERTDHIPIVLLTAKVTQQDRIIGLSHGADAYLAKPFNKAELFTRLDQLILLRKKMKQKIEMDGFGSFLKGRAASPESKFLKKTIKLIREEMTNHSFGSRQLADKLALSESQLYRKLKSITGKSTAIFIRSVRLQKAKELIQTTNNNISEVAYDTGFNDPSWFSRVFKEEFGFPPSELLK
ncbi:MAG: ATP-binding protein, partial [Flavobacteriaceae bacterium]